MTPFVYIGTLRDHNMTPLVYTGTLHDHNVIPLVYTGTLHDHNMIPLVYRHFARFGLEMQIGRNGGESKTECVFSQPPHSSNNVSCQRSETTDNILEV